MMTRSTTFSRNSVPSLGSKTGNNVVISNIHSSTDDLKNSDVLETPVAVIKLSAIEKKAITYIRI